MSDHSRRKTSMADIARAAAVSEATVDRVLNGRGGVSREKEMRVLEWARKLKIDRALEAVSVRWLRIAILMQQPVAPYYVHLKQGFEVAQKTFESQRVICAVTYFESLDASRVAQTIRHATQKADALIIVAYEHPDITAALRHASHAMPVITLASDLPGTGRLAYVGIDNRCAGRVAGELMGRFIGDAGGKVLVMTGMHDFLGHEERESGFRSVLRRRFPGCDIVETVESREQSALTERLTRDAFRRYPDLRGIYNISVGDEGIAAALRALDRVRSTVLIGHELNESSRRLLIEGALDAVLDQNPAGEAMRSIEIVLRHYHRDPGIALPQQIPVTVLLRENLPLTD
ncbi:Transcriptional regulator, LacI family [Caballeronia glathei]|jgi:LacI family transcriptional regulator|uniref:LacI family transcriptional regulator n=2 Tax=Caballeronia glathei TaxID=60547 RepID=A0A069PPU5_9BURK|nr:LacI family transcriptional regulator [Caballeronia glathei]TCK36623.1 LacI family transcriptional regulator [Paraburkholderia sp. BL8N3]CDY77089.1 Transcriptional regulator, LacI family [Caballeronia glathei]